MVGACGGRVGHALAVDSLPQTQSVAHPAALVRAS